jgi:hypothetical protein
VAIEAERLLHAVIKQGQVVPTNSRSRAPGPIRLAATLLFGALLLASASLLLSPQALDHPIQTWTLLAVVLVSSCGLIGAMARGSRRARNAVVGLFGLGLFAQGVAALWHLQDVGSAPLRTLAELAVVLVACALLFGPPARRWFSLSGRDSRRPAAWYPDPSGRHTRRFWNGVAWTADVVDEAEHPIPDAIQQERSWADRARRRASGRGR